MAPPPSRPPFSLLIVEDDPAASDILARMIGLEFPGCTIYRADNGVQGLELFKELAPDIIITDVNLPKLDGSEMVREIRALDADATYIVLTAFSDSAISDRFGETGASPCAYLLKPIDFVKLFAAIERCCSERTGPKG